MKEKNKYSETLIYCHTSGFKCLKRTVSCFLPFQFNISIRILASSPRLEREKEKKLIYNFSTFFSSFNECRLSGWVICWFIKVGLMILDVIYIFVGLLGLWEIDFGMKWEVCELILDQFVTVYWLSDTFWF